MGEVLIRVAASGVAPWDALIRERALVLDEMSERHAALDAGKSAETSALLAQVTAAHNELARAVVRGPESNLSEYATLLGGLRSRVDQAERELARHSKRFDEHLAQTRMGFDELRGSIPQGTALTGDFKQAARLWIRTGLSVTASTEHLDFFTRGMVAILAEMRAAFATIQPRALCTVNSLTGP